MADLSTTLVTNKSEGKTERKSSIKQFEKRLAKLEKKLETINSRIADFQDEKKKIQAEISHCKDEQILFMVKSANLSVEEISDGIKLAMSIQRSELADEDLTGLSKSDIEELTASNNTESSKTFMED